MKRHDFDKDAMHEIMVGEFKKLLLKDIPKIDGILWYLVVFNGN